MTTLAPLNEAQLTLLRLFSRNMSTEELQALRTLLLDFYEHMLQNELERVIEEKGIHPEDFGKRLEQQQRTVS